jgi:hypothetical protein
MKTVFALLMLALYFVSGSANAACSPFSLEAKNFSLDWSPRDPFLFAQAAPEQAYVIATWHCDEKYRWFGQYRSGLKRDLAPSPIVELDRLRNLSASELQAWDAAHFGCDMGDATEACKPYALLEPFAIRQLNATRPPPIVWVVRQNGTNASRPVFPLNTAGTARSTTAASNQRVAVGAACGCTIKVIEEPVSNSDAANSWCEVGGNENVATTAVDVLPQGRLSWCVRK